MNRGFRVYDKQEHRMIDEPAIENIFLAGNGNLVNVDHCDHYLMKRYLKMDSTGLQDKNGKEIYEGDIIKNENYKCAHRVIYTLGSFKGKQLKGKFKGYADGMFFDRFEVIGNIYENKELLQ